MAVSSSRAATDTSHRVPYSNARPRRIKLVGIGDAGRRIASSMRGPDTAHVDIVQTMQSDQTKLDRAGQGASAAVLRSIADSVDQRTDALDGADMIFIVLGRGDDAQEAAVIGHVGRGMGTLVTGVVIDPATGGGAVGERGLDQLRQACDMLVITSDSDDLRAMLSSLGTLPAKP